MTRNFLTCFWHLPVILFWHSLPPLVVHCANAAFDCDLQRTYSSVILPPLWGTTYASRHHRCAQSAGRGRWSPCVIKKGQIPNPLFCPPFSLPKRKSVQWTRRRTMYCECIDCVECIWLEVALLLRSMDCLWIVRIFYRLRISLQFYREVQNGLQNIVEKDQGRVMCIYVDISKNRNLKHNFEVDYSAVSKSAPSKMNWVQK